MSTVNHTVAEYLMVVDALTHNGGVMVGSASDSGVAQSRVWLSRTTVVADLVIATSNVELVDVTRHGSVAVATDTLYDGTVVTSGVVRQPLVVSDRYTVGYTDSITDGILCTSTIPPNEFGRAVSVGQSFSSVTGFTTRASHWQDLITARGGLSNARDEFITDVVGSTSLVAGVWVDLFADTITGSSGEIAERSTSSSWQDEAIATTRARWGSGETHQTLRSQANVFSFTRSVGDTDSLVMNSRTGAVSRYTDADIVTVLQTPRGTVYVSSEGFATPDYTANVSTNLVYSPTDYGRNYEFRMENLWIELQGGTDMTAHISTHSDAAQSYSYPIESRTSSVPRATRFVPGRGLIGRFWGVRYTGYAPFRVFKLSADIAQSRRRV